MFFLSPHLLFRPGLSREQGVSPHVWQDVPEDGLHRGEVVGADEAQDLAKRLVVVDVGVVPADSVDPKTSINASLLLLLSIPNSVWPDLAKFRHYGQNLN